MILTVVSGIGWLVAVPGKRAERGLSVYLGYVPTACILLAALLHSLFVD